MSRILIIDDDPQIQVMLRQMLGREGYEIEIASNGQEGIKLCSQKQIDLVITDIFMPEKEGLETISDLKRDYPTIPIIAMSGGSKMVGRPKQWLYLATKLGARSLEKPIKKEDLLNTIRGILSQ
jgi:CheY-like chemotaxis protein